MEHEGARDPDAHRPGRAGQRDGPCDQSGDRPRRGHTEAPSPREFRGAQASGQRQRHETAGSEFDQVPQAAVLDEGALALRIAASVGARRDGVTAT